MKVCTKCLETKNESEFYKQKRNKDGLFSICKSCQKEKQIEYYKNNPKAKEAAKQWHKRNPDYKQQWRQNNSSEYYKNRRANDNNFKLSINLRSRIRLAIKSQRGDKAYKSIELLGCTIEEARLHLESLFQPGMTWENYGLHGWHIDHIIPCDSFDLTDPEEQKRCFHYTNLQPLWAEDNLKKRNNIIS